MRQTMVGNAVKRQSRGVGTTVLLLRLTIVFYDVVVTDGDVVWLSRLFGRRSSFLSGDCRKHCERACERKQ